MFDFKITPLDLCEDKVYVFKDSFSVKRCLQTLQEAPKIPSGIYLTQSQFFASLQQKVEGITIASEYRYLCFWQACVSGLDYPLAKTKAKSFFAFWQEMNSLGLSYAELETFLVLNQKGIYEKMQKKREEYLKKISSLGFADSQVQGYTYALKSDYRTPIVFYDCLSFAPKQKKWLKKTQSKVEMKFSFSREIYDCENFSLLGFNLCDIRWRKFPQIKIKQYEQKIFMDAALLNDGHSETYGKSSQVSFKIFGKDTFLQDCQAFQILLAIKELLQYYQKSQRIPLDKLLRFVSLRAFETGKDEETLLDSKLVLSWIDKSYKFFPINSKYEPLKNAFTNFLERLSENSAEAIKYLKGLDSNPVYLAKLDQLEEIATTLRLESLQSLQFFVSDFANSVVAVDQEKLFIQPLTAIATTKSLAIYNATEPFWSMEEGGSDFFSQKQKNLLGLATKEQKRNVARLSFYSLLSLSEQVNVYTYENFQENVQRASLVDELLQFSGEIKLEKFSDLDLYQLLSLFLAGEQKHKVGEKKDFYFPYSGQPLNEFSYSQAVCFLENAQSYYLQGVLGIREFQPPTRIVEPSLVGEIAHKIFQDWLQSGDPSELDKIATKVLQDYRDKLPDNYHKMYLGKYVIKKIKDSAKEFKKLYAADDNGLCEKSVRKHFAEYGLTLKGRIDYLSPNALYDFKTGSKHYAKMSQLEFYMLLEKSLSAYFYFVFENELQEYCQPKDELPFLRKMKNQIEQVKKEGFWEQSPRDE